MSPFQNLIVEEDFYKSKRLDDVFSLDLDELKLIAESKNGVKDFLNNFREKFLTDKLIKDFSKPYYEYLKFFRKQDSASPSDLNIFLKDFLRRLSEKLVD